MPTFDTVTIHGTIHALFNDDSGPINAHTLDLPENVTTTQVDGYDVTLAIAASGPDFLLPTTLQHHGFTLMSSAAHMLASIGITVDPTAGHQAPTTPQPTPQQRHTPGGFVVITTPYKSQPYTPPSYRFADSEAIRFQVKTVTTLETTEVRVGIETHEDNRWEDIEDLSYFTDAPNFLADTSCGWTVSSKSEADTRQALLGLGWTESQHPFIGYMPGELSFGVLPDDEDSSFSMHDGLCIFVAIKTPHPVYGDRPPFEDDLRPYALIICPEFILGDSMENTFEIDPSMTKSDIVAKMTSFGYTHDADLESYF